MRKLVTVAVMAALAAGGAWWYQGKKKGAEAEQGRPKRSSVVSVAEVKPNRLPVILTANGTVTAQDRVEVRPEVSGVIARVLVQEGARVRPGDVLVQLDDAAEQAQLARVRAQLASDSAQLKSAQADLARNRALVAQQFISQSALDGQQAKVDSLIAALAADRAQIEAAQVSLRQKQVRARIAGQIGALALSPGMQVSAAMATPLLTITRLDTLNVNFNLPERQLDAVRRAQQQGPLKVIARSGDGPRQCHSGELGFIDSTVDSASGNVLLKARFDNATAGMWPGQYVSVALQAGRYQDATTLPVAGVQSGPDGQFAYVVDAASKAQRVPLTLLAVQNEQAIVRGLQAGLKVVVNGGQNIRPGETVQVFTPKARTASAAAGEVPAARNASEAQDDRVGRKDASAPASGRSGGRGKAMQNLAECPPLPAGTDKADKAGRKPRAAADSSAAVGEAPASRKRGDGQGEWRRKQQASGAQ